MHMHSHSVCVCVCVCVFCSDALCIFSAIGTAVCISTSCHHPHRQSPRKQACELMKSTYGPQNIQTLYRCSSATRIYFFVVVVVAILYISAAG